MYKNNNMELDEERFWPYVQNYNVNINDIETNTRVFVLLSMKLKEELSNYYINYLEDMKNDDEIVEKFTNKQINKSAMAYINNKYKQLINTKKYKLINKIKKKYNVKPQDDLLFNFC